MIVLCVRCRRSSAVNSTKSSSTLIYDVRTSGYWVFNKDRTVSDLGHPAPVFPYQTSLHPSAVVALCYRFDCGVDPKNNIKKIFTFVSCRVDSVGGEWKWSHTSVPKKQNTHTQEAHVGSPPSPCVHSGKKGRKSGAKFETKTSVFDASACGCDTFCFRNKLTLTVCVYVDDLWPCWMLVNLIRRPA